MFTVIHNLMRVCYKAMDKIIKHLFLLNIFTKSMYILCLDDLDVGENIKINKTMLFVTSHRKAWRGFSKIM